MYSVVPFARMLLSADPEPVPLMVPADVPAPGNSAAKRQHSGASSEHCAPIDAETRLVPIGHSGHGSLP